MSSRFVPNFGDNQEEEPPKEVPSNAVPDDVSYLSNDTQTSMASRMRSRVAEILTDSMSILQGEPPASQGVVVEEEEDTHSDAALGAHRVLLQHESRAHTLSIVKEHPHQPEQPQAIDFLEDDRSTMTWGRRIALANSHKSWYNPHAATEDEANEQAQDFQDDFSLQMRPRKVTKKELPSLAKAWAYFDHFALPRHLVEENQDKHDLKRAEPGESEQETKLYHPLCTPLSQMGDFGLGIGLYFSTLRALAILTFLAGLLNTPNFMYFSGPVYSDGQEGIPDLQKGSAICTRQQWGPCENCSTDNFANHRWTWGEIQSFDPDDYFPYNFTGGVIAEGLADCILEDAAIVAINTTNNETIPGATCEAKELLFVRKNKCDQDGLFEPGMYNFGTLCLILVGILVMNFYQRKMEVAFDEDEQTAQDYSIRIQNPPKDATDPQEWRKFFWDNFQSHATVVTIALDNDPLVRALRERRDCIRKIELQVEPGTSLDTLTLAKLASETEVKRGFFGKLLAMIAPGIPEHFGKMAELEAKIKGWAQLEYDVSNVFVSFETELEQRKVLSALSLGAFHVKRQNKGVLENPDHLFRGELVLSVKEPDEPNTIRWADLNVKAIDKIKPLATTTTFSLIFILLIALLVQVINNWDAAYAAIAIAIFNSVFPIVAKMLTDIERHSSEGLKQTSLYVKIAVFRWVNTAVVITIISPFTITLDEKDGLIPSIYAIFFAEIITTNAIQLFDPVGHIERHYLAPRANTQDAMNLKMQGAQIELAERYTNMTKLLFLALWYCAVFPGALFMCSFALFVNYFTDRFSLMRSWKRLPQLGTNISIFSRRYFFSVAVVAMAVVSAYFWSGFPFDNLCDAETISPENEGSWKLAEYNDEIMIVTDATEAYRFCLQDYLRYGNWTFPALARWQPEGGEWMTEEQELLVNIYGITSLAVMGLVLAFFVSLIFGSFRAYFRKAGHDSCGDDQGIAFSQVHSISAYVPQVSSATYSYPLLACSVDGIDPDLFDWTDPDRPHVFYDLTIDADELLGDLSVRHKMVFSMVSHVPAPLKEEGTNGGIATDIGETKKTKQL